MKYWRLTVHNDKLQRTNPKQSKNGEFTFFNSHVYYRILLFILNLFSFFIIIVLVFIKLFLSAVDKNPEKWTICLWLCQQNAISNTIRSAKLDLRFRSKQRCVTRNPQIISTSLIAFLYPLRFKREIVLLILKWEISLARTRFLW